jgi:ParB-like chromosome segregation protein Spo0J
MSNSVQGDLPTNVVHAITSFIEGGDAVQRVNEIRSLLHSLHPNKDEPVNYVQWIPIEKVEPNDYNPNSVAKIEMGLLLKSIKSDGYTQPIVTIYDPVNDKYVIVDGFHRYFCMRSNSELRERCGGYLPVVVLRKTINERMAATVRHNRARGKHSVDGMSNMVFKMLDNGMDDSAVCNELGMEPEELLRLKHITGFSKLFADAEYNKAWMSKSQIQQRLKYKAEHPDESILEIT